ncbi:unnamed protein product [Moneuplotes crassus]|uniref:Uncharacterized protein n=1 Tax=Euplotes crassus TaxID=5936 RepID=A0AAD1U003_EUPCR|nr:unnamed protein product [Moneuplotes crassus]
MFQLANLGTNYKIMGEARFLRIQEPSYRYEMRSASHLKAKSTVAKFLQEREMGRLSLPRNMNEKAASLISKRLSMNGPDVEHIENSSLASRREFAVKPVITIDFESMNRRDNDSDSNEALTPMTKISKKFYKNKNRINPLNTTKSVRTLKKRMYIHESKRQIKKELERFEEYWNKTNKNGPTEERDENDKPEGFCQPKVKLIKPKMNIIKENQKKYGKSPRKPKLLNDLVRDFKRDKTKKIKNIVKTNKKPLSWTSKILKKTQRNLTVPALKSDQLRTNKKCINTEVQHLKVPMESLQIQSETYTVPHSQLPRESLMTQNSIKKWSITPMGCFKKTHEDRNIEMDLVDKKRAATQRNSIERLPTKLNLDERDDVTNNQNLSKTILSYEMAAKNRNQNRSCSLSQLSNRNKMFRNISANIEKIKFECMLHQYEANKEYKQISAARSALESGKDWDINKMPKKKPRKQIQKDDEIIWDLIATPDKYGTGDAKTNKIFLKNRIITKYNKTFNLTKKSRMHQKSLNIKF